MPKPRRRPKLTFERAREVIAYEPVTGIFRWKVRTGGSRRWNTRYAGQLAGTTKAKLGYRALCIDNVLYRSTRVAWLLMIGKWPKGDIDHVNLIRDDDRWSNLREATRSQNLANQPLRSNNTSGVKGIWWRADRGKWAASFECKGARIHLGTFATKEDAAAAYKAKALEVHGEFARV